MRNKIPCSAERLSLLDPPMIQSVVDRGAFQIGSQYVAENRVRIVEADESQISSAVIGSSGLYEQTIRLKDGHLVSKCSCALPEEPMCRHCIAVLLEYHRWAQPRTSRKPKPAPPVQTAASPSNGNGTVSAGTSSSVDLKLSEVMAFIEWLQPAMKAVERGQPMPDSSKLSGDVAAWAHAMRNLDERRREGEEIQLSLESEIRDREAYVGRLTNQLQASMGEVKTAQVAHQEAMQELATYKSALARVADLATEVGGYDNQLKSIAGDMLSKGTQLEKLATSFREVAAALRTLTKSGPSQ
ncbi:MAG TPA: hypothetical protein VI359_07895 [Nitrospiraceae bacterium]